MSQMLRTRALSAAALAAILGLGAQASAQVVINEFQYDDGGTDNIEFVELYNAGGAPVAIGGWTLGGQDQVGANTTVTITAGTMLNPGQYYVIGQTGVLNVNQVNGTFLENDSETIELRNAGALVDAVVYEKNKGPTAASNAGHGTLPADVVGEVGPGFWGNIQSSDLAGTPLNASNAVGRWVDGRDTNNNGRDFGMRVGTPGSANNPTNISAYTVPNVSGAVVGSSVAGFAYSFVQPRVIDPMVVDGNNPNSISSAPNTGKAIIAWDPSGGGNGATSAETFNTTQGRFDIKAYLDTRDLPLMSNSTGVTFRGSEFTFYGLGSADALANATNISGLSGFTGVRDNGITGLAWVYEKVGESTAGGADTSEKLYLVDANDGGDQNAGDWTILQTIDISGLASDWFDLGISVDAAGNGVAYFNGQTFNFSTSTAFNGAAFSVGYRENTQIGADGTPDAILRPATFTIVPEPGTLSVLAIAAAVAGRRRRA